MTSAKEWPPPLPPDWDYRRLKFTARRPIKSGIGAPSDHDDPTWPRYIRITDIAGPKELRGDTFRSLPPEQAKTAPVAAGDILLAAVGATYGKSFLFDGDVGTACYAGYVVRFSPLGEADPRFFSYWTQSRDYWYQVNREVIQSTVQNFSASRYQELLAPYPPPQVQRAIASFLDRETARIDTLIEKKRRLLDLLEEKRTALIARAVTRGLDPEVRMKDSGVEWIGEIPEHWKVLRLKYLLQECLSYGANSSGEPFDPDLPRYIRITDIDGESRLRDHDTMKSLPWSEARAYLVQPGDILLARSGATVGKSFLISDTRGPAAFAGYLIRARARRDRLQPEWLWYFTRSASYANWLTTILIQATIQNVSAERYANLWVPVPPLSEQQAVLESLSIDMEQMAKTKKVVRRAIHLLEEYRSALVSAAVTGQAAVSAELKAPAGSTPI